MTTLYHAQKVGRLSLAAADDIPTPPSPTGQYPDPVWAEVDYTALVQAAAAEDVPAPPSPTGQYPDPVWAEVDYRALVQAAAAEAEQTPDGASAAPPVALDNQEVYQIIRAVATGISGEALYEHVDVDAAATDGIRVGLVGFRQANGELGQLLKIMQRRDPSLLAVIMGQDVEMLLQVTNADSHAVRAPPPPKPWPLELGRWLTKLIFPALSPP